MGRMYSQFFKWLLKDTQGRHFLFDIKDFNNSNLKVSINVFFCDSPAEAYILKIKSHSGIFIM